MTTPLDVEIRSWIARVLTGEATLRDFYRWFVPATWEVERSGNAEAIRLTHALALLLNEFSAGDITADDVKRQLVPFAESTALVRS